MHRKWWTLLVVCVATFMLLLDITIVNVALPSIQKSLHASFQDLQWVVDAYALTLAGLLLSAGSLADLLGRKRIFLLGIAVFGIASLICGLAVSPLMLTLTRDPDATGVDWLGLVTFSASLFLLVLALIRGNTEGWSSTPILAELSGAVVLFALFLAAEMRQARPMFDLTLFRKPTFAGVSIG